MVCWDMSALKSNRSTVQSESARRQTGLVLQPVQASSAPKISIFIIQKLFHCAIQQDACIVALLTQFHKMRIAGILMHACVQAVQNIPVAARLDAVEHSALL